jgi:hypothetical protein
MLDYDHKLETRNARLDTKLHTQFLHFLVVIFAVEDVPFLTAFKNCTLLIFDLVPRRLIDFFFLIQQVFQNLAHFQPESISILEKLNLAHLRPGVRNHVRHFIYFVAANSHSTALYLRTSSFFTLRNIS